jgi:hypothetical protein
MREPFILTAHPGPAIHDLRNPINSISVGASLLAKHGLNEKQQRTAARIQRRLRANRRFRTDRRQLNFAEILCLVRLELRVILGLHERHAGHVDVIALPRPTTSLNLIAANSRVAGSRQVTEVVAIESAMLCRDGVDTRRQGS